MQPTSSRVGNWEYRRSDSPFYRTGVVWMTNPGGHALRLNLHNVACHLQWTVMLIYFWGINVSRGVAKWLCNYMQLNTQLGRTAGELWVWTTLPLPCSVASLHEQVLLLSLHISFSYWFLFDPLGLCSPGEMWASLTVMTANKRPTQLFLIQ